MSQLARDRSDLLDAESRRLQAETGLRRVLHLGDDESLRATDAGLEDPLAFVGDARTRAYTAGTILGSGTVSNADPARGVSCLAEQRAREAIVSGHPSTRFMKAGDTVSIEMLDETGRSVFGRIEQKVVAR